MTVAKEITTDMLKTALLELVQEEPAFLLELLKKAVEENQELSNIQKAERRKRIEALIREDFAEIGDVYKALA